MFEFVYPKWFWFLLILIPYILYEVFIKNKKRTRIHFSRVDLLKKVAGHSSLIRFLPIVLRSLVIILLIITLARPRIANKKQEITGKGIDIMLVIDVSGSMKAIDFKPVNRLESAKKVAINFIEKRRNDRIGLVIFAENAYTQCPLTLD